MKRLIRIALPDVHFPFHDSDLLDIWLDHVEALHPHGIDILGDLIDCYALSRFDRNPNRKGTFQDEIDQAVQFLTGMRSCAGKDCDIRMSEGNHEHRHTKVLWGKAPGLATLRDFTIPQLLHLKKLGIKWHSIQNPYQIRDLWYTHGDVLRKHAGMSARAKSDAIHGSVMIAHSHREGWSPYTTWKGIEQAYDAGHVSDYTQLDYVHTTPNWQQGWPVVEFLPEGVHDVSFARVHNVGKKRIVVYKGEVIAKL
jgi:hypothetical protein